MGKQPDEVKLFTRKPLQVKCMQWLGNRDSLVLMEKWAEYERAFGTILSSEMMPDGTIEKLHVKTQTGDFGWTEAEVGDWVLLDKEGWFYPVKESIFNETYEEVTE